MRTAVNRGRGRKPDSGGMFARLAEEAVLATPEGQAMRARIDEATCEFFPRREAHVRQITLLCLRVKGLG